MASVTAEAGELSDTGRKSAAPDTAAAAIQAFDWQRYFGARTGCFVGFDAASGAWTQNDPERCAQRFRPFSTYKIPHALIGLETGAVSGADSVIEWDRQRYPAQKWWPEAWRGRHDLRSAFASSVVPYFRSLARRIGTEAMAEHLRRFKYGNQQMAGELDYFWLTGGLAISAHEQIAFLRALHSGELPVSQRSLAIVQDIFVHERGPGYVFRAKTGTGRTQSGQALGWYVGSVTRARGAYFFALNISGESFDDVPTRERIAKTRAILVDLGVLPGS